MERNYGSLSTPIRGVSDYQLSTHTDQGYSIDLGRDNKFHSKLTLGVHIFSMETRLYLVDNARSK